MSSVYDYRLNKWEEYFLNSGEKKYRARQLYQWLYQKQITSFQEMSDLSQSLIAKLTEDFSFDDLRLINKTVSSDETTKYLFELADQALIETVLMRHDYGNTVCVTTQVGCNIGCTFCASGLLKKQRDLTTGEMVAQVLYINKLLKEEDSRVSNVVVMGIGEPFDNYDNVLDFMKIINHDLGLAIGARHITVSTSGIVPRIYDFADEVTQFNLAVSLHAASDELRSKLMPINQRFNLATLKEALLYYSNKTNRRITLEYILLDGVNIADSDVKALKKFVSGLNCYVNLIPYNPVLEVDYRSVDYRQALEFYNKLKQVKIHCTLRSKQGDDISAACGQLRAQQEKGQVNVLRSK